MGGDRFVDIGLLRAFGREIAGRLDFERKGARAFGLGERRGEVDRARAHGGFPFLLGQIERGGFERAVAARLGGHHPNAVGVIIRDRVAAAV